MKSKWILGVSLLSMTAGAQVFSAPEVVLGDVLRSADGSVRLMTQRQAKRACDEQGLRLPTARELAFHSQSLGARGIRESAHPGVLTTSPEVRAEIELMTREGYYPVYQANSAGLAVVDFYFNATGYRPAEGDLGNHWLWSSSSARAYGFSDVHYFLLGGSGHIVSSNNPRDEGAVRCVEPAALPQN